MIASRCVLLRYPRGDGCCGRYATTGRTTPPICRHAATISGGPPLRFVVFILLVVVLRVGAAGEGEEDILQAGAGAGELAQGDLSLFRQLKEADRGRLHVFRLRRDRWRMRIELDRCLRHTGDLLDLRRADRAATVAGDRGADLS